MDIKLKSFDPAGLMLRDISISHHGIEFYLSIFSRSFKGEVFYSLEKPELLALISQLRSMYDTLNGTAHLQFHREETQVTFTMDLRGQVLVSGVIVHYQHPVHRLEIGFWTDQSYLPEFIAGLEEIASEIKSAKIVS